MIDDAQESDRDRALGWLTLLMKCQEDLAQAATHFPNDEKLQQSIRTFERNRNRIESELAAAFARPAFYMPPAKLAELEETALSVSQCVGLSLLLVAARLHNQRPVPEHRP
jgi:hypothetical protein